jgi:protein-S-isoprenylcysteine O-methyltransferase Ste14
MVLNLLAVFGFSFLLIAEFLGVRRKNPSVPFFSFAGYCAVGASVILLALSPQPFWPLGSPTPTTLSIAHEPTAVAAAALLTLAALSGSLLVWSVFLEIPYLRKKYRLEPGSTISKGAYAICRHPGFWWFTLLTSSLAMLRGSTEYFFTISLMIGMDLLLIALQDIYTFPRMFSGYKEYRKSVPFLVPRLPGSARKHS